MITLTNNKPKVGFFGLTGCAGCLLSIIFNEEDLLTMIETMDIISFPFIKGTNNSYEQLDVAFVEGAVISKDDEEQIKQIRSRSKIVIALGACAHLGNIPAMSKFRDKKDLDYLKYEKKLQLMDRPEGPSPLQEIIKVDHIVPGCPPDRDEIKKFIKYLIVGKEFKNYDSPVCAECKLQNNGCLLEHGKICLGPIIAGGCQAVCPTNGLKCYGCRGFVKDAAFDAYFKILEKKGFVIDDVKKVLETFQAIDAHKLLDKKFKNYTSNKNGKHTKENY